MPDILDEILHDHFLVYALHSEKVSFVTIHGIGRDILQGDPILSLYFTNLYSVLKLEAMFTHVINQCGNVQYSYHYHNKHTRYPYSFVFMNNEVMNIVKYGVHVHDRHVLTH